MFGGGGKKRIAHTSTELICVRIGIDPINLAAWFVYCETNQAKAQAWAQALETL
jgi:hypothetical protein